MRVQGLCNLRVHGGPQAVQSEGPWRSNVVPSEGP